MKILLLFTFTLISFNLAAQPKVLSQFTQYYFPNLGEWIGDEKAFFNYDDEERLIRKETFDYTRHKTRLEKLETWTYSTSGELTQQTFFEVNGPIYTDPLNWYYNDAGQLDSLINIHYSSEWRLEVWKYKMKYEGENLVEFQQTYTPDWLITPTYSDTLNNGKEIVFQHSFYEYNDEGCLSQKINIYPQSHVEKSDKETFEYGENCQLIKSFLNISNFLNPDTLARKYRRFHSSDVTSNYRIDTIYSERFYNSSSNWEYDSLVIFKYDEQDRLMEKEFDSEIFYNSGKELWEYNGDGQLVKYFKSLT